MNLKNLLKFLRLIETIPIEYMVSGSIASILYGKPRLTQDMDIVVLFHAGKVGKFVGIFNTEEYYCPPAETIEEAIRLGDKGHLNIIDQGSGFKIDIYPAGKDELVLWGLENKREIELIEGERVWVAPPEYVILKKLVYFKEGGSEKHLEDIRGMMDVSGDLIDTATIEGWVAKLKLLSGWKKATNGI